MNKEMERILQFKGLIEDGLRKIKPNGEWLDAYKAWSSEPAHKYDSILYVHSPLTPQKAGDREYFDFDDSDQTVDFEVIRMSAFLSVHLHEFELSTVDRIRNEVTKHKKIDYIRDYFDTISWITESHDLSCCILALNDFSIKQAVLYPASPLDLSVLFASLRSMLRKETSESIFFIYTLWRLTQNNDYLFQLISSTTGYIRQFYSDYNTDPDMKLNWPIEKEDVAHKILIIVHWFEYIAFHTNVHAGASPAQIGMKTGAAESPVHM